MIAGSSGTLAGGSMARVVSSRRPGGVAQIEFVVRPTCGEGRDGFELFPCASLYH